MKKLTLILIAIGLFVTVGAQAAKYVDPQTGDDANDGSMGAPWKTLVNIHNLSDTVYISDSAPCYFGPSDDRVIADLTLRPWSGTPTIVVSNNAGTQVMNMLVNPGDGQRLRMYDLKWVPVGDVPMLLQVRFGNAGGKTLEVVNCEFDFSQAGTRDRRFHLRSDQMVFRFISNLVYKVDTDTAGWFINNEQFPYNIEMHHNRFYDFQGGNAGVLYAGGAGCHGAVVNNTTWGCRYFVRATASCPALSNINNLVEYHKSGDSWWRGDLFCDYSYSGDSEGSTFSWDVTQGISNQVDLTEVQIAFNNTNDVSSDNFLAIEMNSVCGVSGASDEYTLPGLQSYAGARKPVPEPGLLLGAVGLLTAIFSRRTV